MAVRAAVVSAPGRISLERFPDPQLAPGEALVRMELSGICGTDKHIFRGEGTLYAGTMMETRARFPVIPGHENVGVIEEIGRDAERELEFYGRRLQPGDRIVMCPDVVCGRCWHCRHGRMLWCENAVCYGVALGCEEAPHLFGGWAEHMVLRSDAFVYKVPDGLPPELAVLVEPLVVTSVPASAASTTRPASCVINPPGPVISSGASPANASSSASGGSNPDSRSRAHSPALSSSAVPDGPPTSDLIFCLDTRCLPRPHRGRVGHPDLTQKIGQNRRQATETGNPVAFSAEIIR